jgi:hypothetical protein
MKIKIVVVTALLLFNIIACDKNSGKADFKTNVQEFKIPDIDQEKNETYYSTDTISKPFSPDDKIDKKQPGQSESVHSLDWDKKIIKTASLNIEVKDYNQYYSQIREKVKNIGGYIAQEDQNQSEYKIENSLVIKVPVDQFDNALFQLTEKVEKINEKKVSSQDVTTEIIDVKSRMESKKQVRQRYIDLLKQAKNMEEILTVQSEINAIQEDIESSAGRIEYLGHSSIFSTINLTYYQVLNSSAKDNEKLSFGKKIGIAFKTGLDWVGDLSVGLISIWPLFLVTLFAYILFRKYKNKNK